ncbi:MAG: hypothetical protein R3F55_03455 [Alphaproteobacteria bacterium]
MSDGIDISTLSGGSFTVQGNDLIRRRRRLRRQRLDHQRCKCQRDRQHQHRWQRGWPGLRIDPGGVVTVSGNQSITGAASDAIEFEGVIGLGSTVSVTNNVNLIGYEDGIDVFDLTSGTFAVANNAKIQGQTLNGIGFNGFIFGTAQVSVHDNTDILGDIFGIAFSEEILGDTSVSIDRNGTATQGGTAYDGTAQVSLATFLPTGRIEGGIAFSAISGNAALTVSRNIISGGNDDGIGFAGAINSTNATAVHNNFVLDNGGNGVSFTSTVGSAVEVFQNFIAGNGGNGVNVGRGDIGTGLLLVQQNFLPGSGFAQGNGGFGYSQLRHRHAGYRGQLVGHRAGGAGAGHDQRRGDTGAGSVHRARFQCRGSARRDRIRPAVCLPERRPGRADRAAGRQRCGLPRRCVAGRYPAPDQRRGGAGDPLAGRAGADSGNVFDNVFADPYSFLAEGSLNDLAPAAGGANCQLLPTDGGVALACNAGGGGSRAARAVCPTWSRRPAWRAGAGSGADPCRTC